MSKAFKSAPEADKIVAHYLSDVHDHLADFPIRCIMQDEPNKSKGKIHLADIRKVTGLQSYLAGAPSMSGGLQESLDFDVPANFIEPEDMLLICIFDETWSKLTEKQRYALIDHELSHARVTEDEKGDVTLTLIGHDVEEFYSVIERHGDWKNEIKLFKVDSKVTA